MNALETVRASLARVNGEIRAMEDLATKENRSQYASEARKVAKLNDEIATLEARESELAEQETRRQTELDSMRKVGGATVNDAAVYRSQAQGGKHSFFSDIYAAQRGNYEASERLSRNNAMAADEQRAVSTGAGSGAAFAPPKYLVDQWVELARPSRTFADTAFTSQPLPVGVSQISVPKLTTGTLTGVQATENTNLAQQDIASSSLTSGITTIGGTELVSLQLLNQSGAPGIDQVIMRDLANDYSKQLNNQVINGSGASGQVKGWYTAAAAASVAKVTWTQASPTIPMLFAQIGKLVSTVNNARFQKPDYIVMTPTRWAWLATAVDGQGRPLVVPTGDGGQFNGFAGADSIGAQGSVGRILGIPVFVDPLLPSPGGTQDVVVAGIKGDAMLFESEPVFETFNSPYANQASVLFRALGYLAAIPNRQDSSLGLLTGTGLILPTFAG